MPRNYLHAMVVHLPMDKMDAFSPKDLLSTFMSDGSFLNLLLLLEPVVLGIIFFF